MDDSGYIENYDGPTKVPLKGGDDDVDDHEPNYQKEYMLTKPESVISADCESIKINRVPLV